MSRYFKITEISGYEFVGNTGEDLDCCQLVVPIDGEVYVAIDDTSEDEISVSLDNFDRKDDECG